MTVPTCVFAQQNDMDVSSMDASGLHSVFCIPEEDEACRWDQRRSPGTGTLAKPRCPRRRESVHRETPKDQEQNLRRLAPSVPQRKQSIIMFSAEDLADISEHEDEEQEASLIRAISQTLATVTDVSKDSLPPKPMRRGSLKRVHSPSRACSPTRTMAYAA